MTSGENPARSATVRRAGRDGRQPVPAQNPASTSREHPLAAVPGRRVRAWCSRSRGLPMALWSATPFGGAEDSAYAGRGAKLPGSLGVCTHAGVSKELVARNWPGHTPTSVVRTGSGAGLLSTLTSNELQGSGALRAHRVPASSHPCSAQLPCPEASRAGRGDGPGLRGQLL